VRRFAIIILFLLGCSSPQIKPPQIEPTFTEQQLAEPLNACQRGKYYKLIKTRNDMIFYIYSGDADNAEQAAKNLIIVDGMITEMLVKSFDKKCKN